MSAKKIDFDYEKNLLYENMKDEELYRKKLIKEVIEATTYKKGNITKEVFKLPMPTKNFIDNKNVNVRTYGAIMLNSNWGGKFLNPNDRYLYKDKFVEVIEQITQELNISQSTIKRHINKLKKCDIKAIELTKTSNNELVYRLNYGVFNEDTGSFKDFITITNVALRQLVNAYSENTLRIYLYLLQRCYNGETYIKQEEICKAIGLSYKTRKVVTDCVEALVKGGFIKVKNNFNVNTRVNKKGEVVEHIIPNYYYSLSEDYLFEAKKNID